MTDEEARAGRYSRRVFITLASTFASAQEQRKAAPVPTPAVRYADRATEFPVVRLTNPEEETWLPSSPGRCISRKSDGAVIGVRTGEQLELQWLSLGNGARRHMAQGEALGVGTAALTSDDRWVVFAEGDQLVALQRESLKRQPLVRLTAGATLAGAVAASGDRLTCLYAETAGGEARVRLVRIGGSPQPQTVAEAETAIAELAPNPRRALAAWRSPEGGLWTCALDGGKPRRVETPDGEVLQFHWARDGQSILYLHQPADRARLVEIREQQVDSRSDQLVTKTSQFASFSPNANGSVFVGASRSKASPHILLLLRATKREFTLCEHGETEAAACLPVFTPDSQSVVFTSRMHGKWAVYRVAVERLIEKTQEPSTN